MKSILIDGIKYVPQRPPVTGASKVFEIGSEVFIKTVTYHYTGRIVDVAEGFVFLEDVAWIADSGRFTEFMKDENEPQSFEAELYGDKIVKLNIGSITEVVERKLVLSQK